MNIFDYIKESAFPNYIASIEIWNDLLNKTGLYHYVTVQELNENLKNTYQVDNFCVYAKQRKQDTYKLCRKHIRKVLNEHIENYYIEFEHVFLCYIHGMFKSHRYVYILIDDDKNWERSHKTQRWRENKDYIIHVYPKSFYKFRELFESVKDFGGIHSLSTPIPIIS